MSFIQARNEKPPGCLAIAFAIVLFLAVSIFGFYWGVRGILTGTTLFASKGGPLYVSINESPSAFWYSVIFLLIAPILGISGVVMIIRTKQRTSSRNADFKREREASLLALEESISLNEVAPLDEAELERQALASCVLDNGRYKAE